MRRRLTVFFEMKQQLSTIHFFYIHISLQASNQETRTMLPDPSTKYFFYSAGTWCGDPQQSSRGGEVRVVTYCKTDVDNGFDKAYQIG
jgi:hypothetical protein